MINQQPETPFTYFKKKYSPLYRTLLILGFLAALISLANLSNIRTTFNSFSTDIFYGISSVITTLIVPAFMISSLILLWHKHPTGIRLRLAGYGASIIASVIGFFTSHTTLERITQDVLEQSRQSDAAAISLETAATLTEATFYGALYLSIGASLLFAWLWWKAWKRQIKIDAKRKTS